MAWNAGFKDLKSVFSANFSLLELKNPFALDSRRIFDGQTAGEIPKKLCLYVVSKL